MMSMSRLGHCSQLHMLKNQQIMVVAQTGSFFTKFRVISNIFAAPWLKEVFYYNLALMSNTPAFTMLAYVKQSKIRKLQYFEKAFNDI